MSAQKQHNDTWQKIFAIEAENFPDLLHKWRMSILNTQKSRKVKTYEEKETI